MEFKKTLGFMMGVQERSYLAERPIDEPVGQRIAPSAPVISLEICDLQKQIEQVTAEKNGLQKQHKQAVEKVKEMHLAAMCRPEVAELIGAIEIAVHYRQACGKCAKTFSEYGQKSLMSISLNSCPLHPSAVKRSICCVSHVNTITGEHNERERSDQ